MRPRRLVFALMALLAAGCGGDSGGDGEPGGEDPRERPAVDLRPAPESVRASRQGVDPRVAPERGRRDTVVRVRILSRVRLGEVRGGRRRAYVVTAQRRGPMPGCVQHRDVVVDRGRRDQRLRARVDPGRGKGGHLGWCTGSYRGTIQYRDGIACPATGRCEMPDGFETLSRNVGRFSFTVRR